MNENDWIVFDVPDEWEQEAQRIREMRDKLYENIYLEESTDLRWVGDLGEICFHKWIDLIKVKSFDWHIDNAAGKPDFTINKVQIDVKTVKRKVPPKLNYTAQITAKHKNYPINELFFMSYEHLKKRIWLLGGIQKDEFLKFARFYGEGEQVHPSYYIRKGHEIYNAAISTLQPPRNWIERIVGSQKQIEF
jgi:hypothetical protein